MDSVLVLTSDAYYVADYDETSDRLLAVQRVPLADVTHIELGPFDANSSVRLLYRRSILVIKSRSVLFYYRFQKILINNN